VLLVLFALLIFSFFLVGLCLRYKKKTALLKKQIIAENEKAKDVFLKLSFGILNQRMNLDSKTADRDVRISLETMKSAFNKITDEPLKRVCYVGTDPWFEGIACARYLGNKMQSGRIAIVVTSSLQVLIMFQRYRSFVHTLKTEFPDIEIIDTFEAHANFEEAQKYAENVASKVDAIYVTGNSMVPAVGQGIQLANQDETFIVCHDLDAAIVSKMRDGIVASTLLSSTYAQGYDSVIHLFNYICADWKPFQPRLMQKMVTVTLDTLSEYWDDVNNEPLRTANLHFSGCKPLIPLEDAPSEQKTIVVLAEDWNTTFRQMITGMERARSELALYNCEVKIFTTNQLKRPMKKVLSETKKFLDKEYRSGLDGIVAFVGFQEIVPLLNAYADKNIPIVTYNSEALSIRSMIEWMGISATQLSFLTNNYKNDLDTVEISQNNILNSLNEIVDHVSQQTEAVATGAQSVNVLAQLIDKSAHHEQIQVENVNKTTKISNDISDMVTLFTNQVEGLNKMELQVKTAVAKTDAIKTYSEKIESIISILDGISEQTNLLAFNAAVESTHAGEWGKGFKVISEEIRLLADQSVASTSNIQKLIFDMNDAVNEGIVASNTALEIVNEQVNTINNASVQLSQLSKELFEAIKTVQEIVYKNADSFKQMKSSATELNSVMGSTKLLASENNDNLEKISASFTEMNSQFVDMNHKLVQLAELANIMEGTVSSFNCD